MIRDRPNVLIIMSDQHSKHVLGCYGNELVRTPNLDRISAEGVRFTNAYCPAPLCVPSRMSFMTGRTPSRNRVWDNPHILSSGVPCWTHALGAAGYETALIGRMHFVGPDQRHGFERRPLGESSAGHPGAVTSGRFTWTRVPEAGCSQDRRAVEIVGTGTTQHEWFDRQVTAAAVAYLREKAQSRGIRPFVAVAGFVLPHNPYVAPKALFDYYRDRVNVPQVESNVPASTRRHRRKRHLTDPDLPVERVRLARAAYFALCELVDSLVGRILDCLDETGLARDTLVIYCSDHGEMAGEHGLWCKSAFYEGAAGVPLLARLPGTIAAGSVCESVVNLIDVGPTVVDLAGAEPMPAVDGRSLWPTLTGRHPADWTDETYSELADLACWPRDRNAPGAPYYPSRMVRSGRWKLWLDADEDHLPPVLFDLVTDPDERRDLDSDPRHRPVRDALLAKVARGWDPAFVRREAADATQSFCVLRAWGRTLRPHHPDHLPDPDTDIEQDVVLL
jgi:choline-sulfatase